MPDQSANPGAGPHAQPWAGPGGGAGGTGEGDAGAVTVQVPLPVAGRRLPLRWSPWLRRALPVVVIPALLYVAPQVYNNQLFLVNLVVYLVLTQGVNLIYGYTGYLPFGYVGFFGAGAYGAYLAVQFLHVPGIAAVLCGGVAATAVGLLFVPLLRLAGAYFALASLAAAEALYYIISNGSLTSITNGPYGVNLEAIFNQGEAYIVGLIVLAAALAVIVWAKDSRFGLRLRAIRSDPVSASMAGVNVVRARTVAWLISAALAGLAGAVFAWTTSVFYPDTVFSLSISLFAIVFALFGGVGSILGPVVGTVVLYSLYQYIGLSAPQYFQLIFGLLIVGLVLFFPGGLTSLVRHTGKLPAWLPGFNRLRPGQVKTAHAAGAGGIEMLSQERAVAPPETYTVPDRYVTPGAQTAGSPVLTVSNLSKSFGAFEVLRDVSFEVVRGKALGLVGPNGSGKTTLINLVSGVYEPTRGEVGLRGEEVTGIASHRLCQLGLNRTFQIPRALDQLTVAENVAVVRHNREPVLGADPLEFVGLAGSARRLASSLTSGEKKLLDLARALASGPEVLLVDELGAGLSENELEHVGSLLLQLKNAGLALVVVEHLMGFLEKVVDAVIVLDAGEVLFRGALRDAISDRRVVEVFLGE